MAGKSGELEWVKMQLKSERIDILKWVPFSQETSYSVSAYSRAAADTADKSIHCPVHIEEGTLMTSILNFLPKQPPCLSAPVFLALFLLR